MKKKNQNQRESYVSVLSTAVTSLFQTQAFTVYLVFYLFIYIYCFVKQPLNKTQAKRRNSVPYCWLRDHDYAFQRDFKR